MVMIATKMKQKKATEVWRTLQIHRMHQSIVVAPHLAFQGKAKGRGGWIRVKEVKVK